MGRWLRYLMLCLLLILPPVMTVAQEPARIPEKVETVHLPSLVWHVERADAPKLFSELGPCTLALAASGHPHVAYGGDHLYHAWHDGDAWHIETVDASTGLGWYTSLALDAGGRPHISYYDATDGNLKYAYFDGVTWRIETVDSVGSVGGYTSLVLDGADRPHISYYDWDNQDLKYARFDGSFWQIETVDGAGRVGRYPSPITASPR